MGAVYHAEHTHMRKRLAVKVLHPEMSRLPEVVARFEREAMAAAHIEHPNVAAATDFGKLEDGSFFLVLEYVEGRSLRDVIADGPLELARALHIARQIASALGRAHALGIVHRDLKPENVMLVARDGDPDFVKVLDFGIAKVPVGELVGESQGPGQVLTQLGMVYGTPEYMAPEQALGQTVDARADLYALGVIMFEMLAGVRPFEHESKVTLLGMHVTAPIPRDARRAPDANVPARGRGDRHAPPREGSRRHRFDDAKDLADALDGATAQLAGDRANRRTRTPLSRGRPPIPSSVRLDATGRMATRPWRSARRARAAGGKGRPAGGSRRWSARRSGAALKAAPPWVTPTRAGARRRRAGRRAARARPRRSRRRALRRRPARRPGARRASRRSRRAIRRRDDVIAAAQAKIDKGDFATAIDALTARREDGARPRGRASAPRARVHGRAQRPRGDA